MNVNTNIVIWPGFPGSHQQRSSNEAKWLLTIIIRFHHSIAHMLMKPLQNPTQLVQETAEQSLGSLWKIFSCSRFCSLILAWSHLQGPCHLFPALPAWSDIHIQVPSFHTCKLVDVQRARVLSRSCSVHKLSRSPSHWHHVQGTLCHSDNKLYFQGPSLSSCHPLCPQDPSRIQAHSLKHWAGSAVFPIPSSLFLSFLPIYEKPLSHFPLTKNNFFNHILSGIFHQFPRLG